MIIIIGTLDFLPPDCLRWRFVDVYQQCGVRRNQIHSRHGEHLQLFFKKEISVFRITTTVFHIAPFVCVCWSECVCGSLCLTLVHFAPPPKKTPPHPPWTPCPAAEWHSNNEWCFCSRRLYWLWTLWASLSFILLGEYFEIKEKVDVTWDFLFILCLFSYWFAKWCVLWIVEIFSLAQQRRHLFVTHTYCNYKTSPMLFFLLWKTQVICVKFYEKTCYASRVCSVCVLLFTVFMFRVHFLNQHKASAVCVCGCICVCVRSARARGCVKYNCCVRKWKVSICQSGGMVSSLRVKPSFTLMDQWCGPVLPNMWGVWSDDV